MFSQIIKDKADSWYGYMGSSFMQGIDEWCELRTSKVTDENKPWRFSIPLDLLSFFSIAIFGFLCYFIYTLL